MSLVSKAEEILQYKNEMKAKLLAEVSEDPTDLTMSLESMASFIDNNSFEYVRGLKIHYDALKTASGARVARDIVEDLTGRRQNGEMLSYNEVQYYDDSLFMYNRGMGIRLPADIIKKRSLTFQITCKDLNAGRSDIFSNFGLQNQGNFALEKYGGEGNLRIYINRNDGSLMDTTPVGTLSPLPVNQIYTFSFSYDRETGTLKQYTNEVLNSEFSDPLMIGLNQGGTFHIMNDGRVAGYQSMIGYFYNFLFYDRVLTDEEIASNVALCRSRFNF